MTSNVLDYQPKESDIFLKYEGVSVFERKIYNEPVALLDSEVKQLKLFHEFLTQNGQVLPEMFINDPARYDLRYLTAA